ncbi:hypothetical protein PFBG_02977 [Plasmodium falciparum 7G8]|uniref:Uncharacterized protein n=4 Tax=Plasmodium falciparum TaxID=5833 RepID=W7JYF2_PLAFO|nr:hypothetical protein PFTANZ_02958 [Plasmodium falciparum Tanzania (2000708)]ETW42774.1 hypothetical protein PFNF135_03046 [Plasmodium falciparum NF135/5.C10]EUR71951.1 hypothetical protein PFBG_02977 [Plasmodium falciparum 7G8]EWC85780.1 hypothetical protein PFNF54_05447 [Plasmodium falciparum NF54]
MDDKRGKKLSSPKIFKSTKEERILKKHDETKLKWEKQNKILKDKTKKKETLGEQAEKYRAKNEVNMNIYK